jgi:hypothetical protein
MSTLGDTDLLALWEDACTRPAPLRPLALLAGLVSERPLDELAVLPIGERDRLLLEARRRVFGARLPCFTRCPACDAPLEFDLDAATLSAPVTEAQRPWHELRADGWTVRFRLIDSGDLVTASTAPDAAAARTRLLERIVLSATDAAGRRAVPGALSPAAQAALAQRLGDLDPQADLTLALHCAACDHDWAAFVDIAAFFWSEMTALARRLLLEVHTLARAYGWTERVILGLSGPRRDAYLRLVTA